MSDLPMIAGAGGGCFRKGTKVQLEHGKTVNIEDLWEGDEILAFDEDGKLHVAKVEKVHVHKDPQPILRVKFWRGEVFITPNHWVLNQYSSFVEIQTLTTEDALVDGMGHLRPIISFELVGHEPVYNLTVSTYHTFIANGIRVHNGGHRETHPVVAGAGMGGGKGGGGRAAKEDPESLQSRTMVSIMDLIGEGQIGGLLNNGESIFFNDTPLRNSDGTFNAKGVSWAARYGWPNQEHIPGYADIETPTNVSVQCKTTTPVTFTISNANVDRVRAIVTIPSLTSTDLVTGDLHGSSVEYKFQVSKDGGPYYDAIADYVLNTASTGTVGGHPTITSSANTKYVSCTVRLDATGTISYKDFTWGATAEIQPQIWNGSSWIDRGLLIKIAVSPNSSSWVSRFSNIFTTQKQNVTKDAYVEVSYESADPTTVRLFVKKITSGATISVLNAKSYEGSSTITVSGKTRSRYQRAHMIALPKPATTWNVRMVRITEDSTSSALTNDTYLDTYVEIVDTKLSYAHSAVVGITIDAELFNKIPRRSYLVDGLYIRVPSNYDPASRTYTGVWNGTFKVAISNNPAWVLFDILTNTRYGLGQYLGENGERIDKSQLYAIGRYCDEMVSDGFDGVEPRFTINTVIQSQAEAYRLITDIASVFQGMCFWAGGMVGFTQDSPTDPSMIYTPANVVDGLFTYSGTARKDRHSVVHVTWNDPLDNYKQKIEYVEDATLVAKYGIRKTEIVAFGCTSRGQANRAGRWMLYTEQFQSSMITFDVGIDSAMVMPGEVVLINDPTRAGKRMGGRLVAVTATSATFHAPITIAGPAELSMTLPDSTFIDRDILQGPGTYTTVTWTSPLATLPLLNSMFIVSESSLVPMQARVVGVAQQDSSKARFTISAVEHNPAKYSSIENGWTLSKPVTSVIKSKPDMPTSLVLTDILYRSGANYASKLHGSWDNNTAHGVKGWNVRVLGPSKIWQEFPIVIVPSIEIPGAIDGESYTMEVRAVNALGIQSDPAAISRTVMGKDAAPSNVTGISVVEIDGEVKISWTTISDIDLAYYEVRKGSDWATATFVGRANANFINLGKQTAGTHTWLIRARDTTEHYSELDGVATITVGLPATPTVVAAFVGSTIEVGWSEVAGVDGYYVEIEVSGVVVRSFNTTTNHFSYTLETSIADGGPYRQITAKVRSRKGNNLSLPGIAVSDLNAPPAAPTIVTNPGLKSASVTVSLAPELDYAGTLIHGSTTSGFTPDDTNKLHDGPGTFFMHVPITETHYYKAAHYDDFGKSGLNYSSEYVVTPVTDVAGITTVTSLPANPAAVGGELAIFLDVVDTEVRGIYGWDGTQWVHTKGLSDGVVTEAKLAPDVLSILEDLEVAPGDIKAEHISNEAITFEKLDPLLAFSVEIQNQEISAEHIMDGAIRYEKMDPNLAFEVEVQAGEITETHIADDSITTPKLRAGSVVTATIAADQIVSNHIQSDQITSLHIASEQILAGHILSDQILANHIKAGEIIGDHIAANQISGGHISGNTISAGHLQANAVTTPKIAAGAITTAKLAVGSFSNLCENNDFEFGSSDQSWTKETNWSIVNDPTNAYSGSWCATRAAHTIGTALRNVSFKCVPGQKYIAGAYIKVSSGTTGGGYVRVSFFDASGAFISNGGGAINTITSTTYQRSETIVVVPANGVTMRVEVVATNTAGTVYVDQVSLAYNAVTIIENGTITTAMIAANQIEGDHIKANQITGSHILAGEVTTDHITADSLSVITANMGDITSGTITLDNQGHIKGGMAGYFVGTGYWMGYTGGAYKFAIGSTSGNYIDYNGTNLAIRGNIAIGYQNYIKGGQSGYNTGSGFFLGWDATTYKLSIGNPSGKALLWDGSTLTIQGDVVVTENLKANAVTQVGNAYAAGGQKVGRCGNWETMQYLSFTKQTNNPVVISMFSMFNIVHGSDVFVRFYLNGALIHERYLPGAMNAWEDFYFEYADYGSAGAKTFHVMAQTRSNDGAAYYGVSGDIPELEYLKPIGYNRSITAMELKR